MNLVSLGSLLALDNVAVALALAPLCRNRTQFVRLVAWFAAVEALAPMTGVLLRTRLPPLLANGTASAIVATIGLSLLGLALARRRRVEGPAWLRSLAAAFPPERWASGGWPTAALAVALGLDNLIAGAGLTLPLALLCGMASAGAVMAAGVLGYAIGPRFTADARTVFCGALLLVAGAVTWA